jgi:hypothetical protein
MLKSMSDSRLRLPRLLDTLIMRGKVAFSRSGKDASIRTAVPKTFGEYVEASISRGFRSGFVQSKESAALFYPCAMVSIET